MPVVSVILPVFNAENLVLHAINSILNQSLTDFELIVVDDASVDASAEVIKNCKDERIRLLCLRDNRGYPVAMNAGIRLASGQYIARMDADDICEPTRLTEQLKALQRFPGASFCGINRYRITPGGRRYVDKKVSAESFKWETWKDLMDNTRLFTDPSVLIEKEKVLAVGGYREYQRSGMDVDLWLRVMERFGPCITITAPLFGKRLEPGSLIFKPDTARINQVPRALARQREKEGKDDIMLGKSIDLSSLERQGLIRPEEPIARRALFVGAAVTCISFWDLKGFGIYVRHAWLSCVSAREKAILIFQLCIKAIRRIRHNPYRLLP